MIPTFIPQITQESLARASNDTGVGTNGDKSRFSTNKSLTETIEDRHMKSAVMEKFVKVVRL